MQHRSSRRAALGGVPHVTWFVESKLSQCAKRQPLSMHHRAWHRSSTACVVHSCCSGIQTRTWSQLYLKAPAARCIIVCCKLHSVVLALLYNSDVWLRSCMMRNSVQCDVLCTVHKAHQQLPEQQLQWLLQTASTCYHKLSPFAMISSRCLERAASASCRPPPACCHNLSPFAMISSAT